ncbi:dTDP-4-dehydrorhamnose 3,5-epimerase [Paenibacillus vini]|uniref:dTDP-4-dehydrorhamnose 3,5-epimerase n=1 Tax=Paenibacillus vini TaxID=1476024 RepID=UPI0025B6E01C|nr:dTDP-4-dehydrorhamnose 3,5-epimerase [Paenibacillus vini]MDN4066519.1 dTDP-4-dehydrorhamnose 3,5-epimerase [Paenibacillus vini]
MNIKPNMIHGCYEIHPRVVTDERGAFVKIFHKEIFEGNGLAVNYSEQYYSRSKKGVLRGLHFQTPPHDHAKLVYCTEGEVLDVVVDLREKSPTYGKHLKFLLSAEKSNAVYIPSGLAHGFYVLSDYATMVYNVTSLYAPESDMGVHWSSAGIDWPDKHPIVSSRDEGFISLAEFKSEFN